MWWGLVGLGLGWFVEEVGDDVEFLVVLLVFEFCVFLLVLCFCNVFLWLLEYKWWIRKGDGCYIDCVLFGYVSLSNDVVDDVDDVGFVSGWLNEVKVNGCFFRGCDEIDWLFERFWVKKEGVVVVIEVLWLVVEVLRRDGESKVEFWGSYCKWLLSSYGGKFLDMFVKLIYDEVKCSDV